MENTHLEGSKMNHAIDVRMCLEELVKSSFIGHIKLEKLGLLATDELNAIQHLLGRIV